MFYSGVVEDRLDPMMLGRCKVRIVGLHTEDKNVLPTESLPWAYPIQPITSAAMSGIGHSPVGPVEGTWVLIIFRDPEQQIPMMVGTLGGIPQAKEQNSLFVNDDDSVLLSNELNDEVRNSDGTPVLDKNGNPLVGSESNPARSSSGSTTPTNQPTTEVTEQFIGPITKDDYDKYAIAIARKESASEPGGVQNFSFRGIVGGQNYGVTNAYGKLGKYQLGGYALYVIGRVAGVLNYANEKTYPSNYKLSDDTIWDNEYGVAGTADYLANVGAQEKAMEDYTRFNYKQMKRLGIINDAMPIKEILGYLAVAHPDGFQRVVTFTKGNDVQDGYGTTSTELYQVGYASIDGELPKTLPQNVPEGASATEPPIGQQKEDGTISMGRDTTNSNVGFRDPNSKYPLRDHLNEPDTNRLARSQFVDRTVVATKDAAREQKIPVAISNSTWNQPESPFNAKYPYNHVYQTESGHVMEFDDTPQNERIHMYHKKGTFTEVDTNGTRVNKVVGDSYEIIDRNGSVYIKGAYNITVDGRTRIFCRSQADIEVVGDAKVYARNNVDMRVSGKFDLSVGESFNVRCKDFNMRVLNNAATYVDNELTIQSTANMNIVSNQSMFIQPDGDLTLRSGKNLYTVSGEVTNMTSNSEFNVFAIDAINIRSNSNARLSSSTNVDLRGNRVRVRGVVGIDLSATNRIAIDGTSTYLQSALAQTASFSSKAVLGGTATPLTITDIAAPQIRLSPVNASFEPLSTPPRHLDRSQYYETEDEGDPEAFIKREEDRGVVNQAEKPREILQDEAPPAAPAPAPSPAAIKGCANFANMVDFPANTKISDNFFLGDLVPSGGPGYINVSSLPHKLQDQDGLTKAQIVCNLQKLAANCLEELIKIVPKSEISITSGYRQKGLLGVESATSQHPKGMAIDFVLKKTPRDRKKHYDLIQEIRGKVPHDQLILEYTSNGSVWIHLSWTDKCRKMAMTFNNHSRVGAIGQFTLVV